MRKFGVVAIDSKQIYKIASAVSARYGLEDISFDDVRDMYFESIPIPILARNGNGCIWVDKCYIAYQLKDNILHYIYLTRRHIGEERSAYRTASRQRAQDIRIPKDITAQYDVARKRMRKEKSNLRIQNGWR
jgi:hypothetical protein